MKFSHIKLYVLSLLVGILTGFVTIPYRYLLEKSDIFRAYFFAEHHSGWFHLLTIIGMWIVALFIYISIKTIKNSILKKTNLKTATNSI